MKYLLYLLIGIAAFIILMPLLIKIGLFIMKAIFAFAVLGVLCAISGIVLAGIVLAVYFTNKNKGK